MYNQSLSSVSTSMAFFFFPPNAIAAPFISSRHEFPWPIHLASSRSTGLTRSMISMLCNAPNLSGICYPLNFQYTTQTLHVPCHDKNILHTKPEKIFDQFSSELGSGVFTLEPVQYSSVSGPVRISVEVHTLCNAISSRQINDRTRLMEQIRVKQRI
jgi:hypothetical protein